MNFIKMLLIFAMNGTLALVVFFFPTNKFSVLAAEETPTDVSVRIKSSSWGVHPDMQSSDFAHLFSLKFDINHVEAGDTVFWGNFNQNFTYCDIDEFFRIIFEVKSIINVDHSDAPFELKNFSIQLTKNQNAQNFNIGYSFTLYSERALDDEYLYADIGVSASYSSNAVTGRGFAWNDFNIINYPYAVRTNAFQFNALESIINAIINSSSESSQAAILSVLQSISRSNDVIASQVDKYLGDINLSISDIVDELTETNDFIMIQTESSKLNDQKNQQLSSALGEYDEASDTTSYLNDIETSGILDIDLSIFASMTSTITFVGTSITRIWSSFGDFAIPLTLMLTFTFVSTLLLVNTHRGK